MSLDTDVSDVLMREDLPVEKVTAEFVTIMDSHEVGYKQKALAYYESLNFDFQKYIRKNRRYANLLRAARMRF